MAEFRPGIRYASGGHGEQIAYMSLGQGSPMIEVPHVQMCHLLQEWNIPACRHWAQTISRSVQLVRYDNRGSGLSAATTSDFSLSALAEEIGVVGASLRLKEFALFGRITGGLPAIVFAATHPDQVSHLILWNSFGSHAQHGEQDRMKAVLGLAASDWQLFTESISQAALGWNDSAAARAWAEVLRQASSQQRFLNYLDARKSWNAEPFLSQVRAPTLVLHDRNNRLASEARSRELAAAIPGAELLAVQSDGGMPDDDAIRAIVSFIQPGGPSPVVSGLTRREQQVLALLVKGASNQKIASELSISTNTVTRHLTHIFAKLEVSNRAEAISLVLAGSGLTDSWHP